MEKDVCLRENTVTLTDTPLDKARDYEQRRFGKRYRTRRFACQLFDMVGKDAHIVDIPCGSGRFFDIFSKARKLTMLDYSENMLKTLEERFRNPENVRLIITVGSILYC